MSSGPAPGGSDHFPGFDVVGRAPLWDPVTAGVVLRRLGPPPATQFFTPAEEGIARALLDRLLGQDNDPRIGLFELIDDRLAKGETDGWHYNDLPDDGQAWKASLGHLDHDARTHGADHFADLPRAAQIDLLDAIRTAEVWHGLPAKRVWSLWMRYACAAFYSHPWSWNEIGFGGPAYPTGYKNLGVDARERWEVAEHDAVDPEPWAQRVERARTRHRPGTDNTPTGGEADG